MANEAGVEVFANDLNGDACGLIRRNAALNGVEVEVSNSGANCVLAERRFDYIDVDPFGPPVRFIDSAVRAVNHGGVLGVTATDTSALCGSSPGACQKKYDALPLRSDCYNELGLRILVGHIARVAMRHEKGITPLFSHCTRHYFRTYVRVNRGPGDASGSLDNVGFCSTVFPAGIGVIRGFLTLLRHVSVVRSCITAGLSGWAGLRSRNSAGGLGESFLWGFMGRGVRRLRL